MKKMIYFCNGCGAELEMVGYLSGIRGVTERPHMATEFYGVAFSPDVHTCPNCNEVLRNLITAGVIKWAVDDIEVLKAEEKAKMEKDVYDQES